MLMGFAAVPGSGPNPEIMLAIDFRCRFCSTFWTSKKWKRICCLVLIAMDEDQTEL